MTVFSRPELEHSQKNSKTNSKKLQKRHFGFIFCQTRAGQAKKQKKKFVLGTIFTQPRLQHFEKKKSKTTKKGHFCFIFSQIGPGQAEKRK